MTSHTNIYDSSRYRLIYDLDGGCCWRRVRDNAVSRAFENERDARVALAREAESALFEQDENE